VVVVPTVAHLKLCVAFCLFNVTHRFSEQSKHFHYIHKSGSWYGGNVARRYCASNLLQYEERPMAGLVQQLKAVSLCLNAVFSIMVLVAWQQQSLSTTR
jgi:hypothetical protein